MKKLSRGFTLIELLVVIGVLGILATGLLAAVDPFEQLKKARDANYRNATIETLNAFTRYYATHGYFPWNSTGTIPTGCESVAASDGAYYLIAANSIGGTAAVDARTTLADCITNSLISDGELKTSYSSGLQTSLWISSGSKTQIRVCFAPEGKALRRDATTSYLMDDTGAVETIAAATGTPPTCPDDTAANDLCMQCFQ